MGRVAGNLMLLQFRIPLHQYFQNQQLLFYFLDGFDGFLLLHPLLLVSMQY